MLATSPRLSSCLGSGRTRRSGRRARRGTRPAGRETVHGDPDGTPRTFTADDVDAVRRHLLATKPSPRTAQKILILLHGVFKLAKRRKIIRANPSADAER